MDREKIIAKLEKEVKRTYAIKTTTVLNGTKVSEEITVEREPCVKLPTEMADKILELLKEQEAVEPMKEHSGSGVTWWNICGNCKTAINPNDKYCHECGRAVKWE